MLSFPFSCFSACNNIKFRIPMEKKAEEFDKQLEQNKCECPGTWEENTIHRQTPLL